MKRTHLSALAVLVAISTAGIAGCGGADISAASPAPSLAATEDLGTPEGALAAVDHAELAIDRMLSPAEVSVSGRVAQSAGQARAPAEPSPASAGAPPPPPPPPPAPVVAPLEAQSAPAGKSVAVSKKSERREHESPQQDVSGADSCSTACAALASMERAAEHLCGMTSSVDGRCTGALARVKSASARVHAACPACS
jgi:hypothetical protein